MIQDAFLEQTENEWDGHLFRSKNSLAKMCGWRSFHVLHARGASPGFPDRVCVRDRILYAELKTETNKCSQFQVDWLDRLASAGGEVYVWLPSDIEDVAKILGHRLQFVGGYLLSPGIREWRPGSLWIPGQGRADGRKVA